MALTRLKTKQSEQFAHMPQLSENTASSKDSTAEADSNIAEIEILTEGQIKCFRCKAHTNHSEEMDDDYKQDWRLFVCQRCGSKSYIPKKN